MGEYVLGHHLKGEGKRLALMSQFTRSDAPSVH